MIATYAIAAAVVLLGGMFLMHRSRVLASLDAMQDSLRDVVNLAEKSDRAIRRADREHGSDRGGGHIG